MKEQWKKFVTRVDAMSLRERVISFMMATVVMLYVVDFLVVTPQFVQQKKLAAKIREDQAKTIEIRSRVEQKIRANMGDPDADQRLRQRELSVKYQRAQADLLVMQKGLIPPDRMSGLVEDLLKRNGRLRLVSLRTLPVTGLSDSANNELKGGSSDKSAATTAGTSATVAGATTTTIPPAAVQALTNPGTVFSGKGTNDLPTAESRIYKHGVEITMQGSYLDMLNYMTELEALPWQLFWSKATLSVDEYPKATLTLTVFTLSLDKKWLNL